MAVVDFDVDSTHVLKYLPQWATSNINVPGNTDLSTWINIAASKVNEAMLKGGFAPANVSSVTTPIAYAICQHAVAIGTVRYYVAGNVNQATDENIAGLKTEFQELLDGMMNDDRIGELTNDDSPRTLQFRHAGTSREDLEDNRFTYEDDL